MEPLIVAVWVAFAITVLLKEIKNVRRKYNKQFMRPRN